MSLWERLLAAKWERLLAAKWERLLAAEWERLLAARATLPVGTESRPEAAPTGAVGIFISRKLPTLLAGLGNATRRLAWTD